MASVGLTEKAAREAGHEVRIGKFPFSSAAAPWPPTRPRASSSSSSTPSTANSSGAHLIGAMATELISELVMAKKLEATEEEIIHAMHPHPTFSESIMEAAGQGLGESVHI